MPTYRNTKTGLTTNVPEQAPTMKNKRGRDVQWQRHIARMNASRRWVREDKAKPGPKPKAKPDTPDAPEAQ